MRLSKVDGSASSEIECAGGIRRVTEEEDGMGGRGRGEADRDGTGAGLATRGGVLSREWCVRELRWVKVPNHIRC